MKVLKRFYSIFFLGLLFVLHILKLPFKKTLSSAEYIERFRDDGIRGTSEQDIDTLLDASKCVCCGICSFVGKYDDYSDVTDDLCRRSRELTTVFDRAKNKYTNLTRFDCPYGIDISRVRMFLYKD